LSQLPPVIALEALGQFWPDLHERIHEHLASCRADVCGQASRQASASQAKWPRAVHRPADPSGCALTLAQGRRAGYLDGWPTGQPSPAWALATQVEPAPGSA